MLKLLIATLPPSIPKPLPETPLSVPSPQGWTELLDWRVGVGLLIGTLAVLGKDLLLEQGRRIKERWKYQDSLNEQKQVKQLSREQELQEMVDKYAAQRLDDVRAQMQQVVSEKDIRIEELKRTIETLQTERDHYLSMSMSLLVNSDDSKVLRRQAAARELMKSQPGLPIKQLMEISEGEEDDS